MSAHGKILVVDDTPVVLEATARGLRQAGYEVLEAGTGQECLQMARAHQPDLILLDVMLPDVQGPDVCRLIKADPSLQRMLVILTSASQIESEAQAGGLEGGADGYIARPIANRELLARVEALLRIQRAEDALRQANDRLDQQVQSRTAELRQANQSLLREIEERKRAEQSVQESRAFLIAIFKSLDTEIAVLDKDGAIVAVNQAWLRFAAGNGAAQATVSVGANYLDVCRRSMAQGDLSAAQALEGIQEVLNGSRPQFLMEYGCDSPTAPHWFLMTVTSLELPQGGAVVGHKDVTDLKETQKSLQKALNEVKQLRDQLAQENVYLREEVQLLHGHSRFVGQSQPIRRVLAQLEQVAVTDSTVLLLGETGTGKELLASILHELSTRRDRAMVCVNCAAIPAALVESELFGREKGAYTGALSRQIGRFEMADGSTLFLDEVSELPAEVQVKLLRVLQERRIERLGNPAPIKVNVRIIGASNKDLQAAIRAGRFREDLFYRLNVFPITVPPLRDRPDDISLLTWAFVEEFSKTFGKRIESITQESMNALQSYSWPGNVRELRNIIERAMIVATGPKLKIELPGTVEGAPSAHLAMRDIEREHVLKVLQKTGWRVRGKNGAAELLALKPSTLESRMLKLGIRRPKPGMAPAG